MSLSITYIHSFLEWFHISLIKVLFNICVCIVLQDNIMLQHIKYGCAKVRKREIVDEREENAAGVLLDHRSLTDTY